jgi:hypothetical protein
MKAKIYLLLGGALAVLVVDGCRIGGVPKPEHIFMISPAPAFLTEDLAIAKARASLGLDGYKTNEWQLYGLPNSQRESHYDNETRARKLQARTAPDGTLDKYFHRSSTNDGYVTFLKPSKSSRTYLVRLEGDRLRCIYDDRP